MYMHMYMLTCYALYMLYMIVCIHVFANFLLSHFLESTGRVGRTDAERQRIEPQRTHSLSCTRHR